MRLHASRAGRRPRRGRPGRERAGAGAQPAGAPERRDSRRARGRGRDAARERALPAPAPQRAGGGAASRRWRTGAASGRPRSSRRSRRSVGRAGRGGGAHPPGQPPLRVVDAAPALDGRAEIQRDLLEEGTLLLEYALGEKASYLWVVSASRVRSYVLPARATIEAAARHAYEGLTTPATGGRDLRAAREGAAAELSRLLLAPAEEALGRQRLLIVAPGLLQYVPFGALPDPREAQAPLLARHEIVTASSASVVAAARREAVERAPSTLRVAVLADPVYERDDPRIAANKRRPHAGGSQRPPARARVARPGRPERPHAPALLQARSRRHRVAPARQPGAQGDRVRGDARPRGLERHRARVA